MAEQKLFNAVRIGLVAIIQVAQKHKRNLLLYLCKQPLTKYFGVRKNLGVAICDDCKMATARREAGAYGEQWCITIPASKKLPPVPNAPGLVPPSTAGSDSQSSHREPKDSKILRYRLKILDAEDLSGYSHQRVIKSHILFPTELLT
jgi:hypothetical protein